MGRWSDVMKLDRFEQHAAELNHFGCYIIGHYRDGFFYPKYVGRGENIYDRIKTYMDPKRCHNHHILAKLSAARHNLWFQIHRTSRYRGLEARQQAIHGIGAEGVYQWNQRVERSCLLE